MKGDSSSSKTTIIVALIGAIATIFAAYLFYSGGEDAAAKRTIKATETAHSIEATKTAEAIVETPTLVPTLPPSTDTPTSLPPTPTDTPTPAQPVNAQQLWKPAPGHSIWVEYKRCDEYPNDKFPEFDWGPGVIHLNPDSPGSNLAWCFHIHFNNAYIDAWKQEILGINPNSQPENLAVYFVKFPSGTRVIVDDAIEFLPLPNKNAVSIKTPHMIRILPPDGISDPEFEVSIGPYYVDDQTFLAVP
jgi:hypothetical protein